MNTQIIKISSGIIAIDKIDEIVEVLRRDGVIAYPTETFYGLGANGFSAKAIQKVYRLKKREASKPLSVVISDISMLDKIVSEIPSFFSTADIRILARPAYHNSQGFSGCADGIAGRRDYRSASDRSYMG